MKKKRPLLCPTCVSPLSAAAQNKECPKCCVTTSLTTRRRLSDYAYEVYRFGYQYRLPFEEQLARNNDIRTHYSLPTPEPELIATVFTILKAFAAKVAYDVIKAQTVEAWRRFRKKKKSAKRDSPDFDKLIQYARDYVTGLKALEPKVRAAIEEEITTDWRTAAIMRAFRNSEFAPWKLRRRDAKTQRAQVEVMIKAVRAAAEARESSPPVSLEEFLPSDIPTANELPTRTKNKRSPRRRARSSKSNVKKQKRTRLNQ